MGPPWLLSKVMSAENLTEKLCGIANGLDYPWVGVVGLYRF